MEMIQFIRAQMSPKAKVFSSFQNIKDGNDPIYPGSNVTKSQSLLLILCFLLRHKLTDVALEDLLLLFNTFFPDTVPATKYKFYKSFQLDDAEVCFILNLLSLLAVINLIKYMFFYNFFIVTMWGLIINFLSHLKMTFSIAYGWDQIQGWKYS